MQRSGPNVGDEARWQVNRPRAKSSRTSRVRLTSPSSAITVVDIGDAEWTAAGKRLRDVEPEEYRRLLALARAFVSIHEPKLESDEAFNTRLAVIRSDKASGTGGN